MQVVVHPITRAGTVDGFIVALGEQTESLSLERRLDVLLARSDERIMLLGADWTILYASPAERRELGAIAQAPFPWERLDAGSTSGVRALFAATVAEPGLRPPITVRVRSEKGHWRVREVAMTNMIDDPGFGGVIVNSRDVTASGTVPSPHETSLARQPTETVGSVLGPPRSAAARLSEWFVVLEAEAGTNAMLCDRGTFQAIARALGHVTGLHAPERYAVQIPVVGMDIAGALGRALERWHDVALPLTPVGWSLVRAEVLTREELDRELNAGE